MSEFWEPWTPHVLQRVRVRLSGECTKTYTYSEFGGLPLTHPPEPHDYERENGRLGTMTEIYDRGTQGHVYVVEYDEGFENVHGYLIGSTYAAIELEPVE